LGKLPPTGRGVMSKTCLRHGPAREATFSRHRLDARHPGDGGEAGKVVGGDVAQADAVERAV
jgi:hypothetical protein